MNNSTEAVSAGGGLGLCVGAWVLGGITLVGNFFTIAAVVQVQHLRTLSNLYIVSLAAADCLVGFMLPVLGLSFLPWFSDWFHQSYASCMALLSLIFSSAFCSGTHLLLVTVDRYIYIVHPFLYTRVVTERTVAAKVTVAWLASFLYGCGTFVANDFQLVGRCDSWRVLYPEYNVYASGGMFFTVCLLIGGLYLRIVSVALSKRKQPVKLAVAQRELSTFPASSTLTYTGSTARSGAISEASGGGGGGGAEATRVLQEPPRQLSVGGYSNGRGRPASGSVQHASGSTRNNGSLTPVGSDHMGPEVCNSTPTPALNVSNDVDTDCHHTSTGANGFDPEGSKHTPGATPGRLILRVAVSEQTGSSDCAVGSRAAPLPTAVREHFPDSSSESTARSGYGHRKMENVMTSDADHVGQSAVVTQNVTTNVIQPMTSSSPMNSVASNNPMKIATTWAATNPRNYNIKPITTRNMKQWLIHWRSVRLFACVFGFYLGCWLPYFAGLWMNFSKQLSGDLLNLFALLGLCNSAVNFFVYAGMNKDFRAYFKRRLMCKSRQVGDAGFLFLERFTNR